MKVALLALILGIVGVLGWTYVYRPVEWKEWSLETQKRISLITGRDTLVIEESLFDLKKDVLLEKYAAIEQEYIRVKTQIEGEFNAIKENLKANNVSIDGEIAKFQQKINEKREQFEQKKAEIEAQIAEIRRQYEEAKTQLQELNDSVQAVRENVSDSVDAIESLGGAIVD